MAHGPGVPEPSERESWSSVVQNIPPHNPQPRITNPAPTIPKYISTFPESFPHNTELYSCLPVLHFHIPGIFRNITVMYTALPT
jgi:hypothetical protein